MAGAVFTSYIVPCLGLFGALLLLNTINSHTLPRMTSSPIGIAALVVAAILYALAFAGDPAGHEDRGVINPAAHRIWRARSAAAVGLRGRVVIMRAPSALERRELAARCSRSDAPPGSDAAAGRRPRRAGSARGCSRDERCAGGQALARRLDLAGASGRDERRSATPSCKAALLALGVVMALLILALGSWLVALCCGSCSAGSAPDVWLSRTGRLARSGSSATCPDFIDILRDHRARRAPATAARSQRVATSLSGPGAEEILATLRQMDLGATRREAFQALRERNDSPHARQLRRRPSLQAEELGVPLADALASIAADTRRMAAQTARRRAQRAAPRITLIDDHDAPAGDDDAHRGRHVPRLRASTSATSSVVAESEAGTSLQRPTGSAGSFGCSSCSGRSSCWSRVLALPGDQRTARSWRPRSSLAALVSYVPLRHWDRIGRTVSRHPAYLAVEVLIATLILAAAGARSPFFYFTLGTAALAGVVYGRRGAIPFSAAADRRVRARR